MKGKRYSEEQILKVLKEIEDGASIASVARAHGLAAHSIYRWRDRYAGMSGSEIAQMEALQAENQRLKRIVANMALEIEAHKELARGKW